MSEDRFNDRDEQAVWELIGRHKPIEPMFGFAARTIRRLEEAPAARPSLFWSPVVRWAGLAAALVIASVGGWTRHEKAMSRQRAETYARVQQEDYLEDYDVIAYLDQVAEENKL